MSRTRFFRQNYHMGGNERAAILFGIHVKRMTVFHFARIGFLAALAGIVVTARLGSASTTTGKGLELRVPSAVIIGAFLGTLLMSIIISSINPLAELQLAVMADKLNQRHALRR